MTAFWYALGAIFFFLLAILLAAYLCFRIAFYVPRKSKPKKNGVDLPEGHIYQAYRKPIEAWIRETRRIPHKQVKVTSFDGLTLYGKYYEFAPGAPIELMFHGYRGTAERDLAGGVQRCFQVGRSALIVDQRCSGKSGGKVITFGIREHRDCFAWLDFMLKHFGPDVKIILTGISMGAATVMMMADQPLPPNVIGILADCGYTSAKDIIQVVIGQMGLPPKLCYPFVKLGARIFGRFDPDAGSPVESLKKSRLPVIFFHGEADDYVPCEMSRTNFEACTSRKKLVTIPGAGHGLSFPAAQQLYLDELKAFFGPEASYQQK